MPLIFQKYKLRFQNKDLIFFIFLKRLVAVTTNFQRCNNVGQQHIDSNLKYFFVKKHVSILVDRYIIKS